MLGNIDTRRVRAREPVPPQQAHPNEAVREHDGRQQYTQNEQNMRRHGDVNSRRRGKNKIYYSQLSSGYSTRIA
ncbi:hypothetical protein Tdes44962_MAKER03566 [Teratosphaeria destructans]|uniref:Uncharacterized protein n=1 Tax=Teratosphaeria destructans TaxID=418781 RepID=A0A9W7SPD5_9PEZI|nr:hypothetical protein Tdes44962_MAKER03566 [Teratosphaeria destructans]